MNSKLIFPETPSLDESTSADTIIAILSKPDWVFYSSAHNNNIDRWIDRYINLQAKNYSFLSTKETPQLVPAIIPAATFKTVINNDVIYDGALYANGGLVRIRSKGFQLQILGVDPMLVKLFKYDMIAINRVNIDGDLFFRIKEMMSDGS